MKKSKLLAPLLGAATIASTVAPLATLTSCTTTVTEPSISFTEAGLVLAPGETRTLKVTVVGDSQVVTWSSTDTNVATVENGVVTAVADGVATVVAEANGKQAKLAVQVTSEQITPSEDDVEYLDTINELMKYGKQYAAPHKAIEALKDCGYDVVNYKLSNVKLEFAFDANVKKFIIMNGDEVLAAPKAYEMENPQVVFKFTNNYDRNLKYGQYLLDNYVWPTATDQFVFSTSIDVGSNTHIKNMKYVPGTNATGTKLIRTYCEYLNIDANNENIIHMGESNNIEVYGASETSKCSYMELGRTAYLYLKNTEVQIAKITSADASQIDVVEADTGVSKGTLFHDELVTIFIGEKISGSTVEPKETTVVKTLEEFNTALTDNKPFIRLGADIQFDAQTITSAITVDSKSFILDLASFDIIDSSGITGGEALINITATSADSYLMVIDSYRQGEVVLNDHFISVVGDPTNGYNATLYLEGANITYSALTGRNGAIEVGETSTTTTNQQYSKVYMFGGVINANTTSTTHAIEATGIYLNNNAYVQVVYGSIYSSVNCIRGNGQYENTYIDIVDATLKTKSTTLGECIYMPNGKLNICGGTFEGHTCIGVRGGNTTISGGYFHATGKNEAIDTASESGSGIAGDGSVICVELCNGSSSTAYGTNPSITIGGGASMQSDNSYILQIYRNNSAVAIDQFLEVDFFGGVYYYGAEDETIVYNGIRLGKEGDITDHCRIYQQKGSWIYTK